MKPIQPPLFSLEEAQIYQYPFPSTRYQGSKRKFVNWIAENVLHLDFRTVLDVFGGTGVVSHMFKNAGKQVTYNDLLQFNWNIGLALIENDGTRLSDEEINLILADQPGIKYPDFIQKTFRGIYFTDEENRWLDHVVYNIDILLDDKYKQALARFALFQAAIIKRPYSLFHRANLYMRTAKVQRSFGNKTTWDTPFEVHFRNFVEEANRAVFDNGQQNQAIQNDALNTPIGLDLVYLDPPYLNRKGQGVDYRDFYHFLEGITSYNDWENQIDFDSKHRRLFPRQNQWNNSSTIVDAFDALIDRHHSSILVISYRNDGIPSKETLKRLLFKHKKCVYESECSAKYAMAHRASRELLLIAP